MRAVFKIRAGFEDVPRFDEAVLEDDMKNPTDQRRKVIRLGPVRAGEPDGEFSLPDAEEIPDESRENNDGYRQGPADSG